MTQSTIGNFMAQLERQADDLKRELLYQARACKPNPTQVRVAVRAIGADWIASPLPVRRQFVAHHLPEIGSKAAFARALGITRSKFRYLLGEG